MSMSVWSAKCGIVAFDSAIRRAIVCWVRDSSTSVVSPLAVVTPASPAPGGRLAVASAVGVSPVPDGRLELPAVVSPVCAEAVDAAA